MLQVDTRVGEEFLEFSLKDCQQEIYFQSHSCILSDFDSLDEATAGTTHLVEIFE